MSRLILFQSPTMEEVSPNDGIRFGNTSWNSTDLTPTMDNATTTPLLGMTDEQKRFMEIQDAMFMFQYIALPFFLFVGLFGNLMTIATMASRQFSHMTSRYILIALAISDTTLLITQPFNKIWIIKLFGTDVRAALSDAGCKAFFHIFRTSKMTSSWFVVLLCFERFVAVVFPLRAKLIIKKNVVFTDMALNYLINGIYMAVWTFSSGIVDGLCKPDLPHPNHKPFLIVGVTIYSFIPSALLLIFTPQIIFKISRQIRLRRHLTQSKRSQASSRSEEDMIRASVMVVCVMVAYIILVLPISIVHIYAAVTRISAFDVNSLGFFVFREVAQVLEQVNYSVNFFFYVLCSSVFRRRVAQILGFSCCMRNGCRGSEGRLAEKVSPGSDQGSAVRSNTGFTNDGFNETD